MILSRWLAEEIDVFLMDEPTRGIDVGAQQRIYGLLYGLAEAGRTVIVVSSDLAEVIGVADRVIVMKEGRLVGDLPKAQATPDVLIKLALPPLAAYNRTNATERKLSRAAESKPRH